MLFCSPYLTVTLFPLSNCFLFLHHLIWFSSLGCKRNFVSKVHLKNHQSQQQKYDDHERKFCIEGFEKLDHVNTLSLDSVLFKKSTDDVFQRKKRHYSVHQNIPKLLEKKIYLKK